MRNTARLPATQELFVNLAVIENLVSKEGPPITRSGAIPPSRPADGNHIGNRLIVICGSRRLHACLTATWSKYYP
jgi:hypothetical protein